MNNQNLVANFLPPELTAISLSGKTQKFFKKLPTCRFYDKKVMPFDELILFHKFKTARSQQYCNKAQFLYNLECIENSLLRDIYVYLNPLYKSADAAVDTSLLIKTFSALGLFFATIAGIVFVGAEGFDGMTTLLSLFIVAKAPLIIGGIIFSMLVVIAFCLYDLHEVSKNLGVKLNYTSDIVDLFIQELRQIKLIKKELQNKDVTRLSLAELEQGLHILSYIMAKNDALGNHFDKMKTATQSHVCVDLFQKMILCLMGGVFFATGFFAGKSIALFVASFFILSISPAAWPILAAGIVIGIAAVITFYSLEGKSKRLLSSKMNVTHKIQQFSKQENIVRAGNELKNIHTLFTLQKERREQQSQVKDSNTPIVLNEIIDVSSP